MPNALACERTAPLTLCTCAQGGRKGNLLMRRFLARLRRWCCSEESTDAGATSAQPAASPLDRSATVWIGKSAERRGMAATALVLRVAEIQNLDVAEWLDSEAEGDAEPASADKYYLKYGGEGSAAAGDASLRDQVREEAASDGGPSGAAAGAPSGEKQKAAGSGSGGAGTAVRWSDLLDHTASRGAGIVDDIASAASA